MHENARLAAFFRQLLWQVINVVFSSERAD